MSFEVPGVIAYALSLPGAVLVEDPRDSELPVWMVAIQHHREHARFAHLLGPPQSPWLYFRHGAERADAIRSTPGRDVRAADVSPRFWSRCPRPAGSLDAWSKERLELSYALVLAKQAGKVQRHIAALAERSPNRFLAFHEAALRLLGAEDVFLDYSRLPSSPRLTVSGIVTAGRYFDHALWVLEDGALAAVSAVDADSMVAAIEPAIERAARQARDRLRP